jgi:hypothetical protein
MKSNTQSSPASNSRSSTENQGTTLRDDESDEGRVCVSHSSTSSQTRSSTVAAASRQTRTTRSARLEKKRGHPKTSTAKETCSKRFRCAGRAVAKRPTFESLDMSTFTISFSASLLKRNLQDNNKRAGRLAATIVDQENSGESYHKKGTKRAGDNLPKAVASGKRQLELEERMFASILSTPAKKTKISPLVTNTKSSPNRSEQQQLNQNRIVQQHQPSPAAMVPFPHDVLIGRGLGAKGHPGNEDLRRLCCNAREAYLTAPKSVKIEIIDGIIRQSQQSYHPPARFLQRNKDGHHDLVDVPLHRVRYVICKVLRGRRRSTPPVLPNNNSLQQHNEKAGRRGSEQQRQHPPSKEPLNEQLSGQPPGVPASDDDDKPSVALVDPHVGPQSRVAVFWPMDHVYYNATVIERLQNCVLLRYDDEITEWLDLTKHMFKVL